MAKGDIPYYMMSCSVYKPGELAGEQRSMLEGGLGTLCQVVSNCIVHHFFLFLLLLLLSFLCFPIKLPLFQPVSFTLFSLNVLPILLGKRGSSE